MNKKLATALFFLGATLFNVGLVLIIALVGLLIWGRFVAPQVPPTLNLIALLVIVFGSMAASFPLYRRAVLWLQTKIDFEATFEPIVFRSLRRGRRD